jgi:ATP-dependent helicase/nuclease subunit A
LKQIEDEQPILSPSTAQTHAVRMITIHGSKGLEFPVVIVPELEKRFRFDYPTVHVSREHGLGLKRDDGNAIYPSPSYHWIQQVIFEETSSEELRLLYVAMTRAQQRLILVHQERSLKALEKWQHAHVGNNQVPMPQVARSMLDFLITGYQDSFEWDIQICDSEIPMVPPQKDAVEPGEELQMNETSEYAYAKSVHLPSKVTASEMKGRTLNMEVAEDGQFILEWERIREPYTEKYDFPIPRNTDQLTPFQRGSAIHKVLQLLDLSQSLSVSEIDSQLSTLVDTGRLSQEERSVIHPGEILTLFEAPLFQRMLRSKRIYRELKFSMLESAPILFNNADLPQEDILLQGVIDCCFQDEDGWWLIDYKTDRVSADMVAQRATMYTQQLRVYAIAIGHLFDAETVKKYLYFTHSGTVFEMTDDYSKTT